MNPKVITVDILVSLFFFFNDTATTEIYTLSLHDALPIFVFRPNGKPAFAAIVLVSVDFSLTGWNGRDRKSTRLNSSHANISYAVFCLKKKKLLNTTLDISCIALTLVLYSHDSSNRFTAHA